MATLADRLKEAMELRNMKQAELSRLTQIAKSSISTYLTGAYIPKQQNVYKMAQALSVAEEWLMGLDVPMTRSRAQNMLADSITDDVVSLPVFGEIAAGFGSRGEQEYDGDIIDIPRSYLKGHPIEDYFLLRVKGDSMYPLYMAGDVVLVLRQSTLNRSGDIGVILIDDELTLKKVEFVYGEDWMKLIPINPVYAPRMVVNEELEKCRVQGIPRMVIREIND